jgi:hypothetical protein
MYVIRELYGCTGEPNVGVKEEPTQVARAIKEIEADDPNLKGKTIQRVGDPAIWGAQTGESIGTLMERERVYFEKGDHSRIDGKMQVHHRLKFDEDGRPMLYVFKTCKHMIRTLPALVYDEKNVEDIDTAGEDHCLIGATKVLTPEGPIEIRSLVGTEGFAYSRDGSLHRYRDVRKTQEHVPVYKVTLEDGTEISATKNHRFLLKDGTWKRLDELREGDDLWQMSQS